MCEQTEISYLDGDVVWVKLGPCWWPGQVTGFDNLSEDLQVEFRNKPLIAAVKFFQEDTYEFVTNYQRIYKYNCTLKEEFIRKGLDKYRVKSKDGTSYMDKFPGDVEMAEKLTGGDPEIILSQKFNREERPDISGLFGEKKLPKKKRDRDGSKDRNRERRSESSEALRKITHPRFLKESDHEVRIRQQPSSAPTTPNNSTSNPQYTCYSCNFTSSRLNVIILHNKTHSSVTTPVRSKVKTYSQPKARTSDVETPKRKYVKKDKVETNRSRNDGPPDSGKRKHSKQTDKLNKKKKPDPELREKLLADWDDESDEEMEQVPEFQKPIDNSFLGSSLMEAHENSEVTGPLEEKEHISEENDKILVETKKLLNETEMLTKIELTRDFSDETTQNSSDLLLEIHGSNSDSDKDEKKTGKMEQEKKSASEDDKLSSSEKDNKKAIFENDKKNSCSKKDDKKSRLSCFDFDEDDVPEPTIPPVRKIPRVFGDKNLSLKKEIIKEFEMSQALKNEQQKCIAAPEEEQETNIINTCETQLEIVEILEVEREKEVNVEQTTIIKEQFVEREIEEEEDSIEVENVSMEIKEIPLESGSIGIETVLEEVPMKFKETDPEMNEILPMKIDVSEIPMDKTADSNLTVTNDDMQLYKMQTVIIDSESNNITTVTNDIVPKVVKKRRGRPRKSVFSDKKSIEIDDNIADIDNEPLEVNEELSVLGSKLQIEDALSESIEKPEEERKANESDTERSYTGRIRKPNRKFSNSEDYLLHAGQTVTKTDDSQSESDDKPLKTDEKIEEKSAEPKKKSRRGKKSAGLNKKPIVASEALNEKPSDEPTEADKNTPSKIVQEPPTMDFEPPEIVNSTESDGKPRDISVKSLILNNTQTLTIEEKHLENATTIDERPAQKSKVQEEIDSLLEETGMPKTSVDILPPKKCQIKKFELSQIDFFEKDASIKKNVIQPEPEERIDKLEDMEIEITRVDPNEKIVDKLPEKIVIEEERADETDENKHSEAMGLKLDSEVTQEIKVEHALDGQPEITIERDSPKEPGVQVESPPADNIDNGIKLEEARKKLNKNELEIELVPKDLPKTLLDTPLKRSAMQTRYKGKFTPETGAKPKKDKELLSEEKPINTFQEAFLKTLQIDNLKRDKKMIIDEIEITVGRGKKSKKPVKKKVDSDVDNVNIVPVSQLVGQNKKTDKPQSITTQMIDNIEVAGEINDAENIPTVSMVDEFQGVEIVVEENPPIETKFVSLEEPVFQESNQHTSQTVQMSITLPTRQIQSPNIEDSSKALTVELPKLDESSRMSACTPSPNSDAGMPIRKREKPRIIENVTLKEPMHILKSKLLEKLPLRSSKHKLDPEVTKRGDSKNSPRAKIMKIESLPANSRLRHPLKPSSANLSLTKKLEALKAEEAATTMDSQCEKGIGQTPQAISPGLIKEKLIQQSSQSLADMELDINSMPFVLSEDVLTPESIEQMPVVITSIISSSSSIATPSISLTPTTQIVTSSQTQYKPSNEPLIESSLGKKKSGTPAILKNKGKAKPTITSIKTLVPPLTGGVKGLKFQNTQAAKTPPLITQKGMPGKYVIVQTSGGQQLRYSVQGKPGTQQKIAIPAGKGPANAQIVQQGGKVVILTSPQSGQTKMIPLNTSKALSGKVQRIMTSKGQVFAPISSQGVISTKTVIAPKTEAGTPTTSKITSQGQKIINTQGLITSKGVLTQIPGTISKSQLLGTLSQGILTKISGSPLAGKTIIGSKTMVTTKGTTILSPLTSQGLVTSKTILAPISQALSGKTILSGQSLVTSKGTVLTPITGQQVKAIAAKSPSKGGKIQYQDVQQKMQMPMLQKSQKIPISSSQMRVIGSLKSPGSTILLQNTVTGQKTLLHGKKMVKQAIGQQQTQALPVLSVQSGSQHEAQLASALSHRKVLSTTAAIQKVVVPRTGRQTKAHTPKIVVQKMLESPAPLLQCTPPKPIANISTVSRTPSQEKHTPGNGAATKASSKSYVGIRSGQQRKNLLNAALNSIVSPPMTPSVSKPISLPALQPIAEPETTSKAEDHMEKMVLKEEIKSETMNAERTEAITEKIEEPKVAPQPQIMALPTESGDGTQTYVLVTIDEQGQIQPLDNNTLMSMEGTTLNPDGTRTLYIDPSSLGDAGPLDNIVLQFDNGCLPSLQSSSGESPQTMISESFPTSEIIQTSNQDILAAALANANTDFQQEIGLSDNTTGSVMGISLTQTSLINQTELQTILQSTIIPPTEHISSASVLETSSTLNQPIMATQEVPSSLGIQLEAASVVSTIPSSLALPLTITNPNIACITAEAQIQIPGNSMPDIGEIIESPAEIVHTEPTPVTTQYLVIPNLDENITIETQGIQSGSESIPAVSYSVSIQDNMILDQAQVQITPSMPIIDDTYTEDAQYTTSIQGSIASEQSFVDMPVSEMLVSKAPIASTENVPPQDVTVTSEMIVSPHEIPAPSQEMIILPENPIIMSQEVQEQPASSQDVYTSQEVPVTTEELILQQTMVPTQEDIVTQDMPIVMQDEISQEISINNQDLHSADMQIEDHTKITATSMPLIEENCMVTSESNVEMQSMGHYDVTGSSEIQASTSFEAGTVEKMNQLVEEPVAFKIPCSIADGQAATLNQEDVIEDQSEILSTESMDNTELENMDMEPPVETEIYTTDKLQPLEVSHADEPSSQGEISQQHISGNSEIHFVESIVETTQEAPSQSYEQIGMVMSIANDSMEIPSQSANKSENSREPTQSILYEPIEIDENNVLREPPTQSFDDSKQNEASQSYETSIEVQGNTPTQSFNEIMQNQEDRTSGDEVVDDQSFPTQSYEVGKMENISENIETDTEINQEGDIPSQSNDIGTDAIGTSAVSTNNSGGNEDETASSSYVPGTPDNQERDQDQESAISTSSYEIPPCEELNIASSSVIPDTSVREKHTCVHDNGVPEIPTSSYNLNPDSSSTHVDAVPTSSYEDQVILEQNVSTSYEVPISMPGLEETSTQNFVPESSDHRDVPSSYYTHHQEVTASYYESVHQESNSRLDSDTQQEVTASYYESTHRAGEVVSEASQSYFAPEEASPSYSNHSITPSYYNPRPESEATQSFYSAQALDQTEHSSSQNVEASQSFYQEVTDNLRLRQQGEATPTYSARYPVDYTLANSPIERHDLVESSVPATRPTER